LPGLFALDWIACRSSSGAAPREIGGTNQLTLGITSRHKPYKYTASKMCDQAVLIYSRLSGLKIVKFICTACALWTVKKQTRLRYGVLINATRKSQSSGS